MEVRKPEKKREMEKDAMEGRVIRPEVEAGRSLTVWK